MGKAKSSDSMVKEIKNSQQQIRLPVYILGGVIFLIGIFVIGFTYGVLFTNKSFDLAVNQKIIYGQLTTVYIIEATQTYTPYQTKMAKIQATQTYVADTVITLEAQTQTKLGE